MKVKRKTIARFQHAMEVIGIPEGVQLDVLRLVAAILHIGNINFEERSDNFARVANDDCEIVVFVK